MEKTTISKAEQASWQEMLSAPQGNQALVAALFFFFSCLALPFAESSTVSAIYILCCVIFYYALSRSIMALLYYAVPAVLLYALSALLPGAGNPMLLPCAFLALVAGGGSGAFLIAHFHDLRRHWYFLLMPVAAYAAVALITGDPLRGLLTLLPLALAVVAGVCLLRYTARTEATVSIAVILAAVLLVAGVITLGATGGFASDALSGMAEEIRGTVASFYTEARALYAEAGMDLMLTDVDITNTAALFVNLLPGLFFCVCGITAFLTWRTLLLLLLSFRSVPRLPTRLASFTMSVLSAILFLGFYIVSIFANSGEATLFGTVCQNVALVLEPGLALIGFSTLFARGRSRSCLSLILAFVLLFVLWSNPTTGLALAAFLGAFHILAARFLPSPDKGDK
ncbi:MAG: DUF2232 domain-containing protein [Clostridia bacterium]|nr:DUF2232 domain-containing protein [Clostridia bacterium]